MFIYINSIIVQITVRPDLLSSEQGILSSTEIKVPLDSSILKLLY